MCCARTSPHNFTAARAFRQSHLGLTFFFVLLAGVTQALPAAAQGGPENPPAASGGPVGGGLEPQAVAGEAPVVQPTPLGGGPEVVPLVPGGGFGFPNPLNPPTSVSTAPPPVSAAAPLVGSASCPSGSASCRFRRTIRMRPPI